MIQKKQKLLACTWLKIWLLFLSGTYLIQDWNFQCNWSYINTQKDPVLFFIDFNESRYNIKFNCRQKYRSFLFVISWDLRKRKRISLVNNLSQTKDVWEKCSFKYRVLSNCSMNKNFPQTFFVCETLFTFSDSVSFTLVA